MVRMKNRIQEILGRVRGKHLNGTAAVALAQTIDDLKAHITD